VTSLHCWCLFAILVLPGCASKWEVRNAPPADVIQYDEGSAYLVTRTNGGQVELHHARVERDSLIGLEKDDPSGPALKARVAIPLADVKSIAVRKPDGVATTFWVATAGVFVVLLVLGAILAHGMST